MNICFDGITYRKDIGRIPPTLPKKASGEVNLYIYIYIYIYNIYIYKYIPKYASLLNICFDGITYRKDIGRIPPTLPKKASSEVNLYIYIYLYILYTYKYISKYASLFNICFDSISYRKDLGEFLLLCLKRLLLRYIYIYIFI